MNLVEGILGFQSEIRDIRRDIHAHPELRFEERRTADLIAARLDAWGIPCTRGLGGTGLVGTIAAGGSRRSIGLRADMDALPIQELNDFAHRSRHEGRMHACGHDGHVAMLLAAARFLATERRFDGIVHLIFQPAEEGGAGAQRMIDDGLFQRFPCDEIYAMHNWPGFQVGQFGVRNGPVMASSSEFEITITGKGAHAAMPHNGIDPVLVASHLMQSFQSIVSRNIKPVDAGVLSVTQIHAGDAYNVIPETAVMRGTVRTFTIEALDLIEARMRRIVEQVPAAFDASATMSFHRNYPPTVNHPRETELAAEVLRRMVGAQNVLDFEPTMGSEDFSFMLLERPGSYILCGNGDGTHRASGHGLGPCMLHNASYDFNDDLIPVGGSFWVNLVESRLAPVGTEALRAQPSVAHAG